MTESLEPRFEFASPVVQLQAVKHLVAAVLKEKGPHGPLGGSAPQGPALRSLWQQCCSDRAAVRSACCDAAVLLVAEGHAHLAFVLTSVLNLLPSARSVQGLIRILGQLLQLQVEQRDAGGSLTCVYSIRRSPHPFITALENRADCWPALMLEIGDFIQRAHDRGDPAYVSMLGPFLHYLYCEPQRLSQHALLRRGLLQVLLPDPPGTTAGPQDQDRDQEQERSSAVSDALLSCLCGMVPYMQVETAEAALELCELAAALLRTPLAWEERWRGERVGLLLHLLGVSRRRLTLQGDCRPPVRLMQQLLPLCRQDLPVDALVVGVASLLLEAPAAQQSQLLALALQLLPEGAALAPWLSPVLVLPLLQLLTCSWLTEPLAEKKTHRLNLDLAQRLLHQISKGTDAPQSGPPLEHLLSSWHGELGVALLTLRSVAASPAAAAEWLLAAASALAPNQPRLGSLGLVVSYLVLTGQEQVCLLALKVVQAMATADPSQVPSLIPVLLYRLGRDRNPEVVHALLYCLPTLGTHRLCIPLLLQTLSTLAAAPKMTAVAMRLLTALWKLQDRVYPELQLLLGRDSQVVGRDARWEQALARAASIRDICRQRPYQHGGDMLAAITLTLSQCSSPEMAVPAAIALHGLKELCCAEVVDILSTWRSLGPRLSCDQRPLMVQATAKLLALVPQLSVPTEDYQKLKEEAVSLLWNYAASQDADVASCGYEALACFPQELHTINHLPEAVRPFPKLSGKEEEEEEEDVSVPGSAYVRLLSRAPLPVLAGFGRFLTALLEQEMEQMPRGVHFSATRGASLASARGKTVAGIPAFMLTTYEKNKQPGLKSGLAAGLLLCYELAVQTDRRGQPIPRLLQQRSQGYQQTLASLIHDVNIQPSEWHRALLLPRAWSAFMGRAFHAVLQGRRADLELQSRRGKEEPEEVEQQQRRAWLWARDQLTNVIRSAVKDSPAVQGNSILALSGLAAAVGQYGSDLHANGDDSHGAAEEFVPTVSWLATVFDTLLSISSSSYKPTGPLLHWFPHRSYSGENTASMMARCCSSLALSLLAPHLAAWREDAVAQALAALQAGLPGSPTAEDAHAAQFHAGLALGLVLRVEHASGASAHKDAHVLLESLDALERSAFRADLEYRTGCLLGLALALAALCRSEQAELHAHVTRALEKLLSSLQDGGQGRMLQEVSAYSVACVAVPAFSRGLVDAAKAEDVMKALRCLNEDNRQAAGFSMALGMLVHGLAACGHGKAEEAQPHLLASWMKTLLTEGCPTMHRLAALSGLLALVGSEANAANLEAELEASSQQQSHLNEVIRAVTQVITLSGAIGLQSNCACLLGHLHLSQVSNSPRPGAAPQDFSYLPERSVLRWVVSFLTEAGRKGPDEVQPPPVLTALSSLASVGARFQLPPINWGLPLAPLMRLGFGEDVQHECLALAASQAPWSQSAAVFLDSWLSPPLVHSLRGATRAHLYESLGSWMRHVGEDKLQAFVEQLGVQLFREERAAPVCQALLRGLAQAMALPNPPKHCWALLCSTTEKIYSILPDQIQEDEVGLYVGLARCLSEMSDTEIERITRVTEAGMEKSCLVLAHLTSEGRLPLLALNDVVAGALRGWPSRRVGWILLQALHRHHHRAAKPGTGVSQQMGWLLELMGHLRSVTCGGSSHLRGDASAATDFLFQVVAGAVVAWGDHVVPLLLGLGARWLPWQPQARPCFPEHGQEALAQCLPGMPLSLARLLSTEPWSSQTDKFIDWLLTITEGPEQSFSVGVVATAKASLLALQSFPGFQKKAVWTRAHGW